ncbi:MAG: NAD(P)H-hydrate epimerase [Deltaproteobacteria bacterium]|nr:NAD(P)H-hydrate epimerase [Deltaproteobacteria bacterium]
MKLVTSSLMLALDSAAIRSGVPSIDLMERAGKGVAEAVKKRFSRKGLVSVVVGKGNNGGDGLVAARYLKESGFAVAVFLLAPWTEFKDDARTNWDRLAGKGIDVFEVISESDIKKYLKKFEESVCIVDAIFGTGLSNEVAGKYKTAIEFINKLVKPVVSVDIPSGLSSDTGRPLGSAIRARLTVTFGLPKVGLMTNTGSEYAHEIEVVDIGIPGELVKKTDTKHYLITPDMFADFFGPREKDVHKGSFGHVLIVGGSTGKIGAGLIASRAALRVGCGLVTYALPKTAYAKFDTHSPEVMYEAVEDGDKGFFGKSSKVNLKDKSVVALGPGIGTEEATKSFVREIAKKSSAPLIIDADGLNCIADNIASISGRKNPVILTPHPGEMSRLAGKRRI